MKPFARSVVAASFLVVGGWWIVDVAMSSASENGHSETAGMSATSHPTLRGISADGLVRGMAAGVLYIDRDGDGYGVAAPLGPDADDGDANVNTPESVLGVYGTLEAFLAHRGYNVGNLWYVEHPDGTAGAKRTFQRIGKGLRAGDVVVFRAGRYRGKHVLASRQLQGTANRPIVVMAYPGEKVVLDGEASSISTKYCRYMIYDGFIVDHTEGSSKAGIETHSSSFITYRNLEVKGHYRGWFAMQDLHGVTMADSVIHDNLASHGIYLGARDKPCSDITVRDNIIYHAGRHGIQFSGRVRNLRIEGNVIHSNSYGGVSLVNGVHDSAVRGNVIFNNNRQGVIFHDYDDTPKSGIVAYDQPNNVVADNIIWVGEHSWSGSAHEPRGHAAVDLNDSTAKQVAKLGGTVIRDNVLMTSAGPTVRMSDERFVSGVTITNNLMCRTGGPGRSLRVARKDYRLLATENLSEDISGNRFADPGFADVSPANWARPEAFDFSRP